MAGAAGSYDVNPSSASVSSLPPSALQHGGIATTWCWSESCNGAVEAHARVMALEQQRARGMRVEPSALASALQRMGLVAVQSGVFDQAVAAYDRLLALAHDDRTPQWAGVAHGNLGCISLLYAQPDLAYWHFQQEVELARASRDKKWEGRACFKVAKCAGMQDNLVDEHKTVHEFLERARDCAEAAGDSEGLARAQRHLAAANASLGDAQAHANSEAALTPGASRDPRDEKEGADRGGGGGAGGDALAQAAGSGGRADFDRQRQLDVGRRSGLPCDRPLLAMPAHVTEKALALQDLLDSARALVVSGGARGGGERGERQSRRALPVLTYIRALAEISGRMTLKAKSCYLVGSALCNLNKPAIGLAWHQKDLKYSSLAGDIAGMQRAVRSLELLLDGHRSRQLGDRTGTHQQAHHASLALLQELARYETNGMTSTGLALIKDLLRDPPCAPVHPPHTGDAQALTKHVVVKDPHSGPGGPPNAPVPDRGAAALGGAKEGTRGLMGGAGGGSGHGTVEATGGRGGGLGRGAEAEAAVAAAAVPLPEPLLVSIVGAKQGHLKQRVGLLNTWKDRHVTISNGRMSIRRVMQQPREKRMSSIASFSTSRKQYEDGGAQEDSVAQEADVVGSTVIARDFGRQPFGFEVKLLPPGKPVHLAAASLQERSQWMDALTLAAEGSPGAFISSLGLLLVQHSVNRAVRVENVQVGSAAHASGVISRGHLVLAVLPVVAEAFAKMDIKAIVALLHGPPGSKVTLNMRDPGNPHAPYVVTIERRLPLAPQGVGAVAGSGGQARLLLPPPAEAGAEALGKGAGEQGAAAREEGAARNDAKRTEKAS